MPAGVVCFGLALPVGAAEAVISWAGLVDAGVGVVPASAAFPLGCALVTGVERVLFAPFEATCEIPF